ncbi:MAG TPA: hypothetical protein VMA35_09490 [Candidatus Sulfopaludibacter sp.]|nr:hypothetical protein [Candidatus Sulfopaludibacter sp.]
MSTAIQSGFFSRQTVVCLCWGWLLALPAVVWGQTNYYATNGMEYAIIGSLPGDQVFPDAAVTTNGGFVVWQDNITDGSGWGVSAMALNGTLSGSGSPFRVNLQGAGDQQNPRVALLQGGGAAFVWQGGQNGFQHIYARFLSSSNTWLTGDVLVNTFTNNFQITPAIATLTNGNVIIVWASYDEVNSTSMQDVYGRIFSPAGMPLTGEIPINQFTSYNQRTPAVAALANGGFVVAWVSEQERVAAPNPGAGSFLVTNTATAPNPSVDVYARLYNGSGSAQGNEFLVNSDFNPCANPDVAAGVDGGFVVVWDAYDMTSPLSNGLDIYARSFSSAGVGGTVLRVNSYLYGDQYAPRIGSLGTDFLIVWTSLTPQEGVYGQFLRADGSTVGSQFEVSAAAISRQIQPVVASDGVSQFLAVWSGFTGLPYSFDLSAQRYINTQQPLEPLSAPFVYAPFVVSNNAYQPQLVVSWPPVTGLSISNYEVYLDGASTPAVVTTSNVWTMTSANGLTVSSTHSFQVAYITTDGRQSPLSPSASGTTWQGCNYMNGGVPCEWVAAMYGTNAWPVSVNTPLMPGGPTLLQVFLSGGDPLVPGTWLRTALSNTSEGMFLSWNPEPGFTYQVQSTATLGGAWTNLGAPRFAAGTTDSIYVGKSSAGYYRVLLLRQ